MTSLTTTINIIVAGFEALGVAVLVLGAAAAFAVFGWTLAHHGGLERAYRDLRRRLGRAILLGLEILVAADIIRSVVIEPTLLTIGALGLLVLVRTFLSWSLEVEITGVWPWERGKARRPSTIAGEQDEDRTQ